MFDTRIFNITDSKSLDDACQLLRQGELVAFPTETVYGLGANALDEQAVKKIFIAKGRPNDNPLIVHISSIEKIHPLISCADDDPSLQLALIIGKRFWPGPISLLFPKSKIVPDSVTGGLPSVVLRIPDHRIALQVLERLEFPLAAPSANTSGRPSPTTSQHVIDDLQGKISGIIEGGCSNVGVESTVLDLFSNPPLILRPGEQIIQMHLQRLTSKNQILNNYSIQ
ncbi:MAG: putative Threonylcarbamoyl-AMP synthase [Streblomastix strix]|uniref:Threonylcarbamoyl-AMP synthase n=1 Tax=Streblomastix strix TaxID=222440 RepID=A0A5J4VZ32_9EUKA|nr:MAG: putative Threonylcarbamoyl-AMP synthase [Streblomastix strix]